MKLYAVLFILSAFLIIGCKKDDSPPTVDEPKVEACISHTPITDIYPGDEIQFTSCSKNATSVGWEFGDGQISQDSDPIHKYASGGNYNVTLIASNKSSIDTISKSVMVSNNHFKMNGNSFGTSVATIFSPSTPDGNYQINIGNAGNIAGNEDAFMSGLTRVVRFDLPGTTGITGTFNLARTSDGSGNDASAGYNLILDSEGYIDSGVRYSVNDFTSGIVTITKLSVTEYEISYNLTFTGKTVEGYYKGAVSLVSQ